MAKKKLVRFGVKNVRYAVSTEGVYGTPKDLAYANSISLEADYEEQNLYGDNEIIGVLGDDKGKTGVLSVINLETDYEIDMKRALEIENGLAEIQQRSSVKHALYFETNGQEDGQSITIKRWLFGVTTGKPSETYNQTTDNPTINPYDYPLKVLGTVLLDNLGEEEFKDEFGNTIKVHSITKFPEDPGYDTFGNTVPVPKAKAVIAG